MCKVALFTKVIASVDSSIKYVWGKKLGEHKNKSITEFEST